MDCSVVIKETIRRETLSKWGYIQVLAWIALGIMILVPLFSVYESKESKNHFRCDVEGDMIDKADSIRDQCYRQYLQQHKFGIPPYVFILLNVFLIPIVTVIYSFCVKSTVKTLKRSHQEAEREPANQRPSHSIFFKYLVHLVVSIAVRITFIVLLGTHFIFPTVFHCYIRNLPSVKVLFNRTQFSCPHDQAGNKNICSIIAAAANGIFLIFSSLEIRCILRRARNARRFMDNQQFYADYLKSNSGETETRPNRQTEPESIPLVERQDRADNISRKPGDAKTAPELQTTRSTAKGSPKCHRDTEKEFNDGH